MMIAGYILHILLSFGITTVSGVVNLSCNSPRAYLGDPLTCTCTTDSASGIEWQNDGGSFLLCFTGSGNCATVPAEYEVSNDVSGSSKIFQITIKSFSYSNCGNIICKDQAGADTDTESLSLYAFDPAVPASLTENVVNGIGNIEITTDCLYRQDEMRATWYTVSEGNAEEYIADVNYTTPSSCASDVCGSETAYTLKIGFNYTEATTNRQKVKFKLEVYHTYNTSLKLSLTTANDYYIEAGCACDCCCQPRFYFGIIFGVIFLICLIVGSICVYKEYLVGENFQDRSIWFWILCPFIVDGWLIWEKCGLKKCCKCCRGIGRSQGGDSTETMNVLSSKVGRIKGEDGSKIREIQVDSGATIDISRDSQGKTTTVKISGSPDAISKATQLINELMNDGGSRLFGEIKGLQAVCIVGFCLMVPIQIGSMIYVSLNDYSGNFCEGEDKDTCCKDKDQYGNIGIWVWIVCPFIIGLVLMIVGLIWRTCCNNSDVQPKEERHETGRGNQPTGQKAHSINEQKKTPRKLPSPPEKINDKEGSDSAISRKDVEIQESDSNFTKRQKLPSIPGHDSKGRGLSANFDDDHPLTSVGVLEKKTLDPLHEGDKEEVTKKKKKKKRTSEEAEV